MALLKKCSANSASGTASRASGCGRSRRRHLTGWRARRRGWTRRTAARSTITDCAVAASRWLHEEPNERDKEAPSVRPEAVPVEHGDGVGEAGAGEAAADEDDARGVGVEPRLSPRDHVRRHARREPRAEPGAGAQVAPGGGEVSKKKKDNRK